jgi:anaerobic selenocysteine-containing dehydrogenase
MNTIRAVCPHDCPDTCAMQVTVQNGIAIKVQGDPDHAPTHGALCTKVSRYPERTYHAERVLHPMKRSGPKGSGQFTRVSWAEALTEIAAQLKSLPQQAVLPYSYAGTTGLVQGEGMAARFFNRLGASKLGRTICASAGGAALAATYGEKIGMHAAFFAQSKLILIWGSNAIGSNLHFWTYAQAAKRAGAKLICIDPRNTETAAKCHQHIALMPGTDGALALGLMHELITHNWLDHDYIARHVDEAGWPALRSQALQWPPEHAAQVCGITADEVRGLARDYAQTQPAAIRLNYGMQRVHGGGNAVRLIALLPCLVGAWRNSSGGLLLSSSGWFKSVLKSAQDEAGLERPELGAEPTNRTINMSTIGNDLLREASLEFGPKIQALIVYNSNPVAVAPDSTKVVKGFKREDLLTIVLEHFMTDTADHADYVLPATTQLEHFDVHTSYGHTYVMLNEPAIAPLGEAKPNTQIFRELAAHMGFSEPCFQDTDEQLARAAFNSSFDFEALRSHGWVKLAIADAPFAAGGFPTPTGRCVIDALGLGIPNHVPNHECAATAPALAARFPLAMISPPARNFLNSTFVNVKSLRDIEAEPVLEMHEIDAQARRINHGQMVQVFNDRGSYLCKAVVNHRARPGVVNGLGVWWRKLGAAGTNVNEVTHQHLTDMGSAATFYDCLVDVRAAS